MAHPQSIEQCEQHRDKCRGNRTRNLAWGIGIFLSWATLALGFAMNESAANSRQDEAIKGLQTRTSSMDTKLDKIYDVVIKLDK